MGNEAVFELSDISVPEQMRLIEVVEAAAYAIMARSTLPDAPDTFQPAYKALDELEAAVTSTLDGAIRSTRLELVGLMRGSIKSEDEARFRFISGTTIRNPYALFFYGMRQLRYSLTGDEEHL